MAVVSVTQRRSRQFRRESGAMSAVRVYRVVCDANTDGPEDAENDPQIPAMTDRYSNDYPLLTVVGRTAEAVEDASFTFDVVVEYETGPIQEPNPVDRPQHVSVGFVEFTETCYRSEGEPTGVNEDNDEVPITWLWKDSVRNTAGDRFDPSIEKTYFDMALRITRFEETFDLEFAQFYQDSVNDDEFTISYDWSDEDQDYTRVYIVPEGTALMHNISAEERRENGYHFWEVSYEIYFRKDGWTRDVIDEGLGELNNGDLPTRPIKDADGDPITVPILLNGHGAKHPGGSDPSPVYLRFQLHKKRPWGNIAF